MKSIDDDIKNGTYKRIYLLYGEERYLKNRYRDKLKEAIGTSDMNVSAYHGKDINIREVIDLAETMPFLSDRRLILLEETRFAKDSCDMLADYIPSIPETTTIVMAETEVSKGSKVIKAADKAGRTVEFAKQDERTLTTWVLSRCKKEKKQITSGAVKLLLERCGTDMVCLDSELEKLFSYTYGREDIKGEDVATVCVKQTEANIFDMITFVTTGRQKAALELYYEMLAMKEPPMRIMYLLSRQFNQLLQIRMLAETGHSPKAITEMLGLRGGFVVTKCLEQSRRFSVQDLRAMLEECVALEEAVKTGKLADTMSVELLIVKYGSLAS